ncbi:Outer membrane receptor [Tenacibaculum litopenaei]|uniref:TonB-dependent receptor n=1 Tax=Tenacibaculum litopenaei TaxID=396016 RepID=UPI003895F3DB
MRTIITTFYTLLLMCYAIHAQTIKGTVKDATGVPVINASVLQKGTSIGTATDFDGLFVLEVKKLPTVLQISAVGFKTQEITVTNSTPIQVTLKEGILLDQVIITGNRSKPRTVLDSPVPIDNIQAGELVNTGKTTFDRMLVFKVPSFNAQNQAISDATAHYDPADLRGLGPSRTLVLINGKRKNQSAQVYLNRTPGKGEVGVDLKSIPTAAIERIEVLRDGASAQYGSDAIAGVLNIILKKKTKYTELNATSGITSKNDGFNFSSDLNTSIPLSENGYANISLGYFKQQITNRAGIVNADSEGAKRPYEKEWLSKHPSANMTVGQPEMQKKDFYVNLEQDLADETTFYGFGGYTTRAGKSFAYYRAPYWRRDVADALFIRPRVEDYIGYQPTFEVAIEDFSSTFGVKTHFLDDKWLADLSFGYGSNEVRYFVNNSVNRDYLKDHGYSPRSFAPGGYSFNNLITNIDFSGPLSPKVSAAVGLEFKKERFKGFEGDALSYYKGGSDSFAGLRPEEAGKWSRHNTGLYAQLDYDLSDEFMMGLAGRYENFSDTGSNFSWKFNTRYKIAKSGAIRASYSTGFRAPSLHQRHITLSQYIIVKDAAPTLQGTLANDNPIVKSLGVPSLKHELSKNLSTGITYKFNPKFSASVDFYQIRIKNRILFSSQISFDDDNTTTNEIEQILLDNNVKGVQFFINAGNTKTTGTDIVLNYDKIPLGTGKLSANLAMNFNKTQMTSIDSPAIFKNNGYTIYDRREQGLILHSRPKSKFILSLKYDLQRWTFTLNNTRFGEVTIMSNRDHQNPKFDQTLSAKIATDMGLSCQLNKNFKIHGVINNIFNVYPDRTNVNTGTTGNGRFAYANSVQQLGQLGTNFSVGLNLKF